VSLSCFAACGFVADGRAATEHHAVLVAPRRGSQSAGTPDIALRSTSITSQARLTGSSVAVGAAAVRVRDGSSGRCLGGFLADAKTGFARMR
jgi:hypothetical protein